MSHRKEGDCICVGLCLTSAGISISVAGVGDMVGTKWSRVTLGDPIWADAYNLALPSSATQMVRGARCRTKGCVERDRAGGRRHSHHW